MKHWWQMIKFVVVGGLSFLISIGTYTFLTRVVAPGSNLVLMNLMANIAAIIFNFFAHREWTYAVRIRDRGRHQFIRYGMVVASATAAQSFLFWFGVHVIGIHDILSAVFAAIICAGYTFIVHRIFTFAKHMPQAKM